jgi:predicted nucleotidyltransferase
MNFIKLIQALVDAGVEFVIIGGWSAILHGSSYATRDLDLCFSRNRANLQKLVKALAPFHPTLRELPPGLPFVWDETTLRNGTLFTLSTDLGGVDLLGEVLGIGSFEQVKDVSTEVDVFDRKIWTLSLRALIQAKKAAGREKDLQILPELQGLLEAIEPE